MVEKLTCAVCGYPTDEDIVEQCPQCNSNICDECTELYDGFCQECFDEVDEDY